MFAIVIKSLSNKVSSNTPYPRNSTRNSQSFSNICVMHSTRDLISSVPEKYTEDIVSAEFLIVSPPPL